MPRAVASIGALGALNVSAVNIVPLHLMNVTLSTVFMAFVGAMLTLAWSEETKQMPKRKVYVSVLFFTMLATTCVAIFPAWLGWEWYSVKLEGSLAFLFASIGPSMVPILKKLLPEIVRKWFKLEPKKEEKQDENL